VKSSSVGIEMSTFALLLRSARDIVILYVLQGQNMATELNWQAKAGMVEF
jgi:hypothetical protein